MINSIDHWEKPNTRIVELEEWLELFLQENDEGIGNEIDIQLDQVIHTVEQIEFHRMLSGEYDKNNAIVSINAGAGGTESQDWASMLLRMYLRWAETKDYKTSVVEYNAGEEAGIKSVTFSVTGEYSYGYLNAEAGVHRLVRISPFDANKRRHTSFASVYVFPEVDDSVNIEIREEDLRIDTYRSSGAGGQHVNTTDSAVRITHIPTNIVVACQNERSQHKNKATALKILKTRIFEQRRLEKEAELAQIGGEKKEIGWGSQIRSYVLAPYRLVKDHRTQHEVGNADAVLDGRLDDFMEAFLLSKK